MSRYPHSSAAVDLKQANELTAALHYANITGASRWWHVSIHWNCTRFSNEADLLKAVQRVRSRIRKEYRRLGLVHHDLFMRENPPDAETEHLHFLLPSLTDEHAAHLKALIEGDAWAGARTDDAVEFVRCGTRPGFNVAGVVLYWLKGGNKAVQEAYKPPRGFEDQGRIAGKRCGVSLSLGPAARARHFASQLSVIGGIAHFETGTRARVMGS